MNGATSVSTRHQRREKRENDTTRLTGSKTIFLDKVCADGADGGCTGGTDFAQHRLESLALLFSRRDELEHVVVPRATFDVPEPSSNSFSFGSRNPVSDEHAGEERTGENDTRGVGPCIWVAFADLDRLRSRRRASCTKSLCKRVGPT